MQRAPVEHPSTVYVIRPGGPEAERADNLRSLYSAGRFIDKMSRKHHTTKPDEK